MLESYKSRIEQYIKTIFSSVPEGASIALRRFTEQFYANAQADGLEKMQSRHAQKLAESAFAFAKQRLPGTPSIRIFTPTLANHGYESHRLVVELINDDMPFLLDSLSMELNRQGFTIYETLHPIFDIVRNDKGELVDILAPEAAAKNAMRESFIHFEVSNLPEGMSAEDLKAALEQTLRYVQLAVQDWQTLVEKTRALGSSILHAAHHYPAEAITEAQDFLAWLIDKNFLFLGHAFVRYDAAAGQPKVMPDSLLGISKLDDISTDVKSADQLIDIRKSDRKSLVHRPVLMDVVIIKCLSPDGAILGEHRLYGLFTSAVYYQSVDEIPFVRKKCAHVLSRAGFLPTSHDGKALKAIIEFLPRDEIFQMSENELLELGVGVMALEAKPNVRLFARRDVSGRFVSCMVFVPREYYSTELRTRISSVLEDAFQGHIENYYIQITDSPMARLQLVLRTSPENVRNVDMAGVEESIASATTLWSDHLRALLIARHGEQKAERQFRQFSNAFSPAYVSRYDISSTVHDIDKIESSLESGGLAVEFFRNKAEDAKFMHLKIYNPHEEIALSDILPTLDHMGLRAIEEQPFPIILADGTKVWIRDFLLTSSSGEPIAVEEIKANVEDTLLKLARREIDDDRFNALVLRAELTYRQVEILRAYAQYLKQIGFTYTPVLIATTLAAHTGIAKLLVKLFEARFNPATEAREAAMEAISDSIEQELAQVTTLAADKILRGLRNVMMATLRTNYYQHDAEGNQKPIISFKFNSHAVPDLPLPKPYAEIFVHSVRVEGIHLRGGKVARGGLRWSDRHEDFRTEVLGLMKAQMVKNSVIVPVGSKGGFVVRRAPAAREDFQKEGIACYTLYLQGLLDITDNIVDGKVVPPKDTVRHDGDDPYLVVAADKGTATFSDTANGVSAAYNFWLGDAFASGGSVGYDHKKMAITARGAWVSVARHFREMGKDIEVEDFTTVGIGDMAGDVFGNGMLLSRHIKLVAAFNHMHIFLDPTPDAAKSFVERERLFNLPRSSWKDYDASLISAGGGIFERSAKRILVSPQAAASLGIAPGEFSPDDLIRAILKAPVDLLWNGGIGTYVKAEDETHEQVGDRTNNALRINGNELRAQVVGEGGNLGFTQKGRIEYARKGGRINTDAIDNSAGVDCSDHEVNIKIAFAGAIGAGRMDMPTRNQVLASMTDEVAHLVLKDNILQTQAITIAQAQGASLLESQTRLMQAMEREGLLDRVIEFLPTDKAMMEMKLAGRGLTRPEIAVLLSYAKLSLYKQLLETSLPDEPYFAHDLARYFPKTMQANFLADINAHPLKREIIATVATNSLVNRAGITFFNDISEATNLPPREVASAYTVARDAFSLRRIWSEVENLGGSLNAMAQAEIYRECTSLLVHTTLWLLRHTPHPLPVETLMAKLKPAIDSFAQALPQIRSADALARFEQRVEKFRSLGVPETLAQDVANLDTLKSALDIITVMDNAKTPLSNVGTAYFDLGARLHLSWLRHYAMAIATISHWDRVAVQSLIHDLYDEQRRLSALAVKEGVDAWTASHADAIARFQHFMEDLKTRDTYDISVLLVALKHIRLLGI